jgi:bacteriocin-like protein
MKTLSIEQMENISGGGLLKALGCGFASVALAGAFVALVTATGGAALAFAAITYSVAPAAWGLACFANVEE